MRAETPAALAAVTWLTALAAVWAPATLRAGNHRSFLHGDEAAMTAGAGVAIVRDAGALWYNPAGLGGSTHDRVELSGSAFVLRLRNVSEILRVELGELSDSDDAEDQRLLSVPTALAIVRQWNDEVSLGLGVFVTTMEDLSLRQRISGAYGEERVATVGLNADLEAQQYDIGPAIGWQPRPGLRLGAAVFLHYRSQGEWSDFYLDLAPSEGAASDAFLQTNDQEHLNTLGMRLVAGVQAELTSNLHVGLVFRSPLLAFYQWGDALLTVDGVVLAGVDGGVDVAVFDDVSATVDEVGVEQILPLEITVAAAYRTAGFWIGGELSYRPAQAESGVATAEEELWNGSIGGRFALSDAWNAGLGLFTDRSTASPPSQVAEVDVDYYGLTAGLQYQTGFDVGDGEQALTFATTLALRYAAGFGRVGSLEVVDSGAGASPLTSQARDVTFHEVSAHVGSSLHF